MVLVVVLLSCSSKDGDKKVKTGARIEFYTTGSAIEGKPFFATCATCHGDQAQGNKQLHAPALANQESWYLYRQLMNFQRGIRGGSPHDTLGVQMASMAKTLPDSNAVADVIAYIRSLPSTQPDILLTGDVTKGERSYQSICGSCHGPGGKGNKLMNAPRLNGLEDWYLKAQIMKFKNSIRGTHPEDVFGSQMIPMVSMLRDEQAMDDVIAYILSTNQSDTTKAP